MMKKMYFLLMLVLSLLACKEEENNRPPSNVEITANLVSVEPFRYRFEVSANDPNGDLLSYYWTVGDEEEILASAVETFSFTPNQEVEVQVRVSDEKGGEAQASTSVNTEVVDLAIDPNTRYQTIEGFGGFGAQKVWWAQEPFYDDAFVSRLINDLGVTILRDNIPISFEPVNENDDPQNLDLSRFNLSDDTPGADSHLGQHIPYLRAMQEAGLQKFIATVWSPPIWMKHNDHRGNGVDDPSSPEAYSAPSYDNTPDENTNQLKRENYEEFAEYCVAYIRTIEQETGLEVYALSIQNEPVFSQFYASAVYSPEAYRDLLKIVGQRLEDEGINTRLFGTEDVQIFDRIQNFLNVINSDPEAQEQLDIIAIHNYKDDGIQPSDEGPSNWQRTREIANANEQQLWMTETSGFEDGWEGAFSLAKSIYNALHFGKVNAWVYWQMSDGGDQALISNGEPTDRYHAAKHFYRYIRPGAVQIGSSSEDEDVLILAYEHPQDLSSTLVLINNHNSDQVVELGGTSYEYQVFQSDAQQEFEEKGSFRGGRLILPAQSVTTLYGI
jgi:O-glycosyl hydrolase